jgi:hypothetical protein
MFVIATLFCKRTDYGDLFCPFVCHFVEIMTFFSQKQSEKMTFLQYNHSEKMHSAIKEYSRGRYRNGYEWTIFGLC